MVDRHRSSRNRRALHDEVARLIQNLEQLARHPNDDLANAAASVLRQIVAIRGALHARDFDRFYLHVVAKGRTLSITHRLREWRAVTGLTIAIYHTLLRQLANTAKGQSRRYRRVPSSAAYEVAPRSEV